MKNFIKNFLIGFDTGITLLIPLVGVGYAIFEAYHGNLFNGFVIGMLSNIYLEVALVKRSIRD
jgi:hypothetical protein